MLACKCTILELTKWLLEIVNLLVKVWFILDGLWLAIYMLRTERLTTF